MLLGFIVSTVTCIIAATMVACALIAPVALIVAILRG